MGVAVVRILDLGAGKDSTAAKIFTREEFPNREIVTVDINPEVEPDIVADVRQLPDDLGEFDAIMASHLLEHLNRKDVLPALLGWAGHLKLGGQLHILVPDLGWALEAMDKHGQYLSALQHIYGGQDNEWQYHRCGFTVKLLRGLIRDAGLRLVGLQTGPYGLVSRNDETGEVTACEAQQIYALATRREHA